MSNQIVARLWALTKAKRRTEARWQRADGHWYEHAPNGKIVRVKGEAVPQATAAPAATRRRGDEPTAFPQANSPDHVAEAHHHLERAAAALRRGGHHEHADAVAKLRAKAGQPVRKRVEPANLQAAQTAYQLAATGRAHTQFTGAGGAYGREPDHEAGEKAARAHIAQHLAHLPVEELLAGARRARIALPHVMITHPGRYANRGPIAVDLKDPPKWARGLITKEHILEGIVSAARHHVAWIHQGIEAGD